MSPSYTDAEKKALRGITDVSSSIIPQIREKEALVTLNTLRLYEEQQDEGDTHLSYFRG